MIAKFKPCKLKGSIDAPPSKSMAHRYLIGAALSNEICQISGIDYSEDILASIDCLKALGAEKIYLYISHCENSILEGELLESGLIEKVFTTNSIFTKKHEKIEILEV